MAVINPKKLTLEWLKSTPQGRNAGVSEDDITVKGAVNVPANYVHWTKASQMNDEKIFKRQVNFVNHKPQLLAQISVPASDNSTRILLERGMVKGLQSKHKVSLPLHKTGLNLIFGDSIKIDPSLPAQERRECKERCSNVPVLSEKYIPSGSISAVIQYKEMESEWTFVCENVTLSAIAIIRTNRGAIQYSFSEIVRALKDRWDNPDLDDLQVVNDQIRFTISGEAVFKWDCQHEVVW